MIKNKFIMALFMLSSMCEFNVSFASDEIDTKKMLSRPMSRSLSKFEEAFKNRDFTKSKEILNQLEDKSDKLSKYERAKLWEAYGNLYYMVERGAAIEYYNMALSEQSGVVSFECSIRLTLARLNYLAENYSDSVASFQAMKENTCYLAVEDVVLSAFSLTAVGKFLDAKEALNIAYIAAKEEGISPLESWEVLRKDINEALVIGYSKVFLPSPKYPRRALARKTEGDVTVRFTFDTDGQAYDSVILKSSSGLFDRSVLMFLSSDKLKPLVKHWNITERTALERTFQFRMSKGQHGAVKYE